MATVDADDDDDNDDGLPIATSVLLVVFLFTLVMMVFEYHGDGDHADQPDDGPVSRRVDGSVRSVTVSTCPEVSDLGLD
jgi:hypothetical protein